MATYKYSTTPSGTIFGTTSEFPVFTISDTFLFDDESFSASGITQLSQSGSVTTLVVGGKTFTFNSFTLDKISKTNFIFADGSQLIVGDGSTTGSTADSAANTLVSTDFNDYMDGLNGSDTVSYKDAGSAVTVVLDAVGTLSTAATAQDTGGAGTDKLVNIENLTGSNYNDTLTGNAGANKLDGGLGIDTLIGGNGNDTYTVTAGDTVTENLGAGTGTDTVITNIDYVLGANVENLTLTGTAVTAIGNSSNNTLIGNAANNVLDGVSGTKDTMRGLAGNDTYFVHNTADVTDETAGGSNGIDLVISTATFTLTNNVENLRLMSGDIDGTGNALANIIYAVKGTGSLDGLAGTDTLSYQYSKVKVAATLGAASTSASNDNINSNFENLVGSRYSDTLKGDAGANTLTRGSGNDSLEGVNGNDLLIGGLGNDSYRVDATSGYTLTEAAAQGSDTVVFTGTAGQTYDISVAAMANIENLTLAGSAATNGTGSSIANVLTGNSAANTLIGNAGDDTLIDGGSTTGADTLNGGAGKDTYIIAASDTTIVESGADIDQVNASVTYVLGAGVSVENLTLTGSDNIDGTGNAVANIIIGNDGDNTLKGEAGNDTITDLTDASGTNTLIGGDGADTLKGGGADDILTGGIDATTGDADADNMTGGAGSDTYNVTDTTDIVNEAASIDETAVGTQDLVNSTVTYALNDSNSKGVNKLTLIGTGLTGTGNSLNNTLTSASGNNTLIGGAGNDTFNVTAGNSKMFGGLGVDTLNGGTGDDTLTGGVDALTADISADVLNGGAGNDTYNVTDTIDDVNEAASGTDLLDLVNTTVTYSIAVAGREGVDNLTLKGSLGITGTGNDSDNTITGNSGNNTLNGGGGNDILTDALGGNDKLDGGLGADKMAGGLGNDTYVVDDTTTVVAGVGGYTGDQVIEAALQGTDVVQASVDYTLAANVENLTLTGSSALTGTGNTLANTITGNNAGDTLIGGDNADNLKGGTGADLLIGGSRDTGSIAGDGTADADTMAGGAGDDTYSVDFATDVVSETGGTTNGTDLVKSRVTYTISDVDVENLTLTGALGAVTDTDAINGTGNASNNTITGNAGNNKLFGMGGVDTLVGGAGTDTLDGGTGADDMQGGTGSDTYVVDNTSDTITETEAGVTDQVNASADYTISDDDVENLTLTGTLAIDGTGNASANVLTGNGAINVLTGLDGADTLDGKAGADTLIGGNGKDTYFVDNVSDSVDETTGVSTGVGGDNAAATTTVDATKDTVNASVSFAISDEFIENLTLTGSGAINATGNSSANILTGNSGNNVLDGAEGNDQLFGGLGKDTMTGGDGADVFLYNVATESGLLNFDVITDFSQGGADKINVSGIDAGTLLFGGLKAGVPTTVSAAHTLDYYVSGANTFLIADTNGDTSTIEFKIQLTGFSGTLDAGDFVL
ncbi:MAG: hypothetical protein CTY16_00130 [Methylobacter sp.]|nr:MAG: hypothetical protein CTY16_00130 [Methylobacter sp.]